MNTIRIYVYLILASIVLVSCEESPVEPGDNNGTGNLVLGDKVDVMAQSVGTSGGSVVVSSPSSPVDGLEIIIPSGSYTDSRTFSISYTPIKESKLKSNLQIISPLISIRNGGGYSDEPMKIRIPVKIPNGYFALGFFWNEETGELEPLHLWDEDSNSITVGTRHFATSSVTGTNHTTKSKINVLDATSIGNILIIAIDEAKLFGLGSVITGFKTGVDDWEYINRGSFIAQGGHCAGQSMTSLWYYYERKAVDGKLFGKFDNVANFQEDDPIGYRFASTIQKDFNFDGWISHVSFQWQNAPLTYKAFALGMYASSQPQSILMYKAVGVDTPGHAMVVNGIEMTDKLNGKLLIADPNHPGEQKEILYRNGVFNVYTTGLRADGTPVDFDRFGAGGKSTYLDWSKIGSRYNEVINKTIGNDRFPVYTLSGVDGSDVFQLKDTIETAADSLIIRFTAPGPNNLGYFIYNEAHQDIIHKDADDNYFIRLSDGTNRVGFYIVGEKNTKWEYVDFRWVTLIRVPIKITKIEPTLAKVGDVITITGEHFGSDVAKGKVVFVDVESKDITEWTDTRIKVKVPQGARTGNVYVYVGGRKSNGVRLEMGEGVQSILPADSCGVGNIITIYGEGFGSSQGLNSKVFLQNMQWGGADCDIISWSSSQIKAVIPRNIMPDGVRRTDTINVIVIVNNNNLPAYKYKVFNPIPGYVYKATGARLNYYSITTSNVEFSGDQLGSDEFPGFGFDFEGLSWDGLVYSLNGSYNATADGWKYEYYATGGGSIDSIRRNTSGSFSGGGRIYKDDTTYMEFTYSIELTKLPHSTSNVFGNNNSNDPKIPYGSIVTGITLSGSYMNFDYKTTKKKNGSFSLTKPPTDASVELLFH